MTREYILQNLEIMCPIIFIDNAGLRDHVMSTLQDSILIPKPKFKVGDKVKLKGSNTYPEFIVVDYSYSPEQKTWKYEGISSSNKSVEDALEIVEEGK